MRKSVCIRYGLFVIMLYASGGYAQTVTPAVALSHYLFDSFSKGQVLLKSGVVTEQPMNYNILTSEMIFDAGGRFLAIAEPQNVDTVFIRGRRFVPVENGFYEVLTHSATPLFMAYTCTIQEPGVSVGYSATSNTTASAALKTLVSAGGAYNLKLPDDFKVKPEFKYFIFKEGRYQKANNAQQLAKVFPDKKEMINKITKKDHTNFSKREEVIALVQQLDQ